MGRSSAAGFPRSRAMTWNDHIAIDIHTHAEVSCQRPLDPIQQEFDEAASKFFNTDVQRSLP